MWTLLMCEGLKLGNGNSSSCHMRCIIQFLTVFLLVLLILTYISASKNTFKAARFSWQSVLLSCLCLSLVFR